MLQSTKTIILNSTKYGDNGLVVKGYTQQMGLTSFFIKNLSKSKSGKFKKALFQPLSQLNLVANLNTKSSLIYIKDLEISYHYKMVQFDITKQSIGLFLTELLVNTLEEHQEDQDLYNWLEMRLIQLDNLDTPENFHLAFIKEYLIHLGIYPILSKPQPYFDLEQACYTNQHSSKHFIEGKTLYLFENIINSDFHTILSLNFSQNQRQQIINTFLIYLSHHVASYKKPRTLEVFSHLF